MPCMYPTTEPLVTEKIPYQESPLSPEWTHSITTLMGHPLSSELGRQITKWIIYHKIHKYNMFALKWNPTEFKLDIHLQMYQETDGSLAYLKGHTVRKLVSLLKYMSLLISHDRPNAQKHNHLQISCLSQGPHSQETCSSVRIDLVPKTIIPCISYQVMNYSNWQLMK